MTPKIAIVGAGTRVRSTVLPAILALGDTVELAGIHSRKPRAVHLPDGSEVKTITSLEAKHFDGVDIVIVAVKPAAIRKVLDALNAVPGKKTMSVVMDTPPLRLSDLVKSRMFRGFKSVIVGEDWIKLSPILAIRDLVASGAIGDPKRITLDRMSYRYHGLATLRALAGSRWFRSMKATTKNGKAAYDIVTGNGGRCVTIMPRDYDNGVISVSGTTGWVSNDPDFDGEGTGHVLGFPQDPSGWHQPTTLDGTPLPSDPVEDHMASLPLAYLEDPSMINRLKIRGYARLIEDLIAGKVEYDITDGLYDFVATTVVERLKRFRDFGAGGGQTSLLRAVLALRG